jgi:hypothetical protein
VSRACGSYTGGGGVTTADMEGHPYLEFMEEASDDCIFGWPPVQCLNGAPSPLPRSPVRAHAHTYEHTQWRQWTRVPGEL